MDRLHLSSKALLRYKKKQVEKLSKMLKKAQKNSTPETTHEIRTTIRRLSILMKNKEIKSLMKALGKERDLHVAKNLASSFSLSIRKINQVNKKLKRTSLEEIQSFNLKTLEIKSDPKILIRFKSAMRQFNSKLEKFSPHSLKSNEMHKFRILLKKVRYGLEAIGEESPKLKEMQEHLGKTHDIDVLQGMKDKKEILEVVKKLMIEDIQKMYQPVYKLMNQKLNAI